LTLRFAAAGRASALLAALSLTAACGGEAKQPAPVAQGEARALEDAAEMLDDRPGPSPGATPSAEVTAATRAR